MLVSVTLSLSQLEIIKYLQKRFRTLAAPTPTNISSNSEPEQKKNGTPASPATALARSVFPVPGLPVRRTPNQVNQRDQWTFLAKCSRRALNWKISRSFYARIGRERRRNESRSPVRFCGAIKPQPWLQELQTTHPLAFCLQASWTFLGRVKIPPHLSTPVWLLLPEGNITAISAPESNYCGRKSLL